MDEPPGEPGSVAVSEAPIRPTAVEPREGYRIWLSYSDGAAGEVDLSHLAGSGVFAAWNDRARFEAVHITDYDAIAWDSEVELCPDALYMQLTGKSLADVMPQTRGVFDRPPRESESELPGGRTPARLGFMTGQIEVPDNFDRMGGPEIEVMFGATE